MVLPPNHHISQDKVTTQEKICPTNHLGVLCESETDCWSWKYVLSPGQNRESSERQHVASNCSGIGHLGLRSLTHILSSAALRVN